MDKGVEVEGTEPFINLGPRTPRSQTMGSSETSRCQCLRTRCSFDLKEKRPQTRKPIHTIAPL